MIDWRTCGVSGGWNPSQYLLFLKSCKSTLCQVSHLMALALVLNQNRELEFECWGLWQVWDFEEVWSFKGLVRLKHASYLKHMVMQSGQQCLQSASQAAFSPCKDIVLQDLFTHCGDYYSSSAFLFAVLQKKTSFWKRQRWNKLGFIKRTSRKQNVYQ